MVTCTQRLEMKFAGVWTDVTADWHGADMLRAVRGIRGNSPKDNIAPTGTMEFSMKNHAEGARPQGYYSPNHANCRSAFGFGTPVRLVGVYQELTEYLWTGKLRVIFPMPGAYGPQRTLCLAHDCMGDIAESDVREVTRQINQNEKTLIDAVLDSLPAEARPVARSIDTGLDTLPVAFDDLEGGAKGLGVLERVLTSVQGYCFPYGDGTLRYQSRTSRVLASSQYTFTDVDITDLEAPSDLANVFNRVRGTSHPKTITAAVMVLATHTGAFSIAALASVEIWLNYADPTRTEVKIGGTDFVTPLVATTDYTFNSAADGSGSNLTASVSIVASFFSSTVKLTITNNHATLTAHKTLLQVRGKGIYDLSPVTRQAFSAQSYGNRPIDLDFAYQADETVVQSIIDYLEASYRDPADQVNSYRFNPQLSDALMRQALTREIGEVVKLSETVSLPTPVSAFIQSVEYTVEAGGWLTTRFGLAPRIVEDEITDDTAYVYDHLSEFSHDPEDRIGFMQIGYSEIG